jgi:integrase
MARRIRHRPLETRESRLKLKARGKPYYVSVSKTTHLGYRKNRKSPSVWVVRRYLGNRSYATQTIGLTDDYVDADGVHALDFWQAQELATATQPRRKSAFTVKDAADAYLAHMEGRPSLQDSTARLKAYVLPTLGDKDPAKLEAEEIRRWHREIARMPARIRTGRGMRQNYRLTEGDEAVRRRQVSANRCLALLKRCLNLAVENGKIAPGQWTRVKPFPGVDVARSQYLTVAEAQRLINAAQGDFRTLVRAALETGCRYGELGRLRVSDLNTDVGTLHIRRSKSEKSRHVVLTDQGLQFFRSLAAGRPGTALLLGRPWPRCHQDKPMRQACAAAHIDPPICFHALRHTWASLSVMAGAPLMVVARNLGHVDTKMVEKHYGHLSPSFVADAIRAAAPRFDIKEPSKVRAL